VAEDQSVQEEEGAQDSFFTTCGVLSAQTAKETTQKLLNQVYLHQLSAGGFHLTAGLNPEAEEVEVVDSFTQDTVSRYSEGEFHGIIIDTGAARRSTAGLPQFKAF
jgi:hypothetical protein